MAERESICLRCFHSYVCEQFNEHRDEKNDKCHFYNDHFVPYADVAPVQKWISVKDRLPEEEGLYLVAVVNDHERRYSKTAWYHGHGNWFLHQKVTHWMPLPEPPKEE